MLSKIEVLNLEFLYLFVVDQDDFDGRIVVLRKSDRENNIIQYHSDIRSDKIAKLKANKNAAMLFYDKDEKIQVRLKVECTVNHENDITKQSWLKTGHMSRKCYLVDNGPGTYLKPLLQG